MSKVISIWEANKDEKFFDALSSKRKSLGELFEDDCVDTTNSNLKYLPSKPSTQLQVGPSTNSVCSDSAVAGSSGTNGVLATPKVSWLTQMAKVVNAYKDGKAVGKVGVALLKNNAGNCKIVVYRTKTKMLGTFSVNLNEESCQLHRQCNYLQFYDDTSAYWSILFDNEEDEHAFIKKLHENSIKVRQEIGELADHQFQPVNQVPSWKKNDAKEQDTEVHGIAKDSKGKYKSVVDSLHMQLSKYESGIETNDSSLKTHTESTTTIMPNGTKSQVIANANMTIYGTESTPINVNNTMESQFLHILLSENRTQNTELRMNMAKLENKIEKIVESVTALNTGAIRQNIKDDDLLELEERVLALKKENRKLKLEIEDRVQANKVNDMEKALKYHKDDLDMLGLSKITDVDTLVSSLIEKSTKFLSDLAKSEVYKNEYFEKLEQTQEQLSKEQEEHNKNKKTLQELESSNKTLLKTVQEKETLKTEMQENLEKMTRSYIEASRQHKLQTEATIKTLMNNLYGNLATKIERLHKLNKNEILGIIGRTIREETLEAVEQIKQ